MHYCSPLIREVCFVPDEHDDNLVPAFCANVFDPFRRIQEGLAT